VCNDTDRRTVQVYDTNVAIPSSAFRLTAVSAALESARVLIVDDAESSTSLELLLHGMGFWTTRVAVTGATALEMAQDFSPSVVLLALDLPDMSAYDVAQQLRERTELRRVRLIALSSDYEHTGRDQARQAGFERYLAKPVTASALQYLLRANHS
jgi:CheY-like chemotaxis protein